MKAVVLEVKNGCSAVLLENGSVVTIPQELEVGRTVMLREAAAAAPKKKKNGKLRSFPVTRQVVAAAAAAAVVVTGSGTFYRQTAYACTYVSVDTSSSIEFSLNGMDRVLDVYLRDGAHENQGGCRGVRGGRGYRGDLPGEYFLQF